MKLTCLWKAWILNTQTNYMNLGFQQKWTEGPNKGKPTLFIEKIWQSKVKLDKFKAIHCYATYSQKFKKKFGTFWDRYAAGDKPKSKDHTIRELKLEFYPYSSIVKKSGWFWMSVINQRPKLYYITKNGDDLYYTSNRGPKTLISDDYNLRSCLFSKARWHPGLDIHFVINGRSKNRFVFAPIVPCASVQIIEFNYSFANLYKECLIKVDDTWGIMVQDPDEGWYQKDSHHLDVFELAQRDGFDHIDDFFNYFADEDATQLDYKEKKYQLIHWTNKIYK